MMKKIILTIILGIFLITLASASLPAVEQNVCIQIKTILNTSSVNISTITYPNETTLFLNKDMTKNALTFNYTFCGTDTIGIYIYDYFDAEGKVYVNDFEVTPTGFILETSDSLLYIIILIATFILFLAFLYPAIKLPYANIPQADGSITKINKTKYFKLLSIWFAYGFLMWFLQTLNAISINFIKLTYLTNFITNIFTYSQWFSVGITFLILIILFIEVWKDIILSQTIKRYGKAFLDGRLQ